MKINWGEKICEGIKTNREGEDISVRRGRKYLRGLRLTDEKKLSKELEINWGGENIWGAKS